MKQSAGKRIGSDMIQKGPSHSPATLCGHLYNQPVVRLVQPRRTSLSLPLQLYDHHRGYVAECSTRLARFRLADVLVWLACEVPKASFGACVPTAFFSKEANPMPPLMPELLGIMPIQSRRPACGSGRNNATERRFGFASSWQSPEWFVGPSGMLEPCMAWRPQSDLGISTSRYRMWRRAFMHEIMTWRLSVAHLDHA